MKVFNKNKQETLVGSYFLFTFAAALVRNYLRSAEAIGGVAMKRESGEKPEQSRCCMRLIGQAQWSLTFFREDRLNEFDDASQKTCRCHRERDNVCAHCMYQSAYYKYLRFLSMILSRLVG